MASGIRDLMGHQAKLMPFTKLTVIFGISVESIYITNTKNIMLISILIVIYEIGIECNVLQVKRR